MRASHEISLSFGDDVALTARRRIAYAFRIFAAVKGARVIGGDSTGADESAVPVEQSATVAGGVRLCYGRSGERPGDVELAARYVPRDPAVPASPPETVTVVAPEGGDVRMPVFHGKPGSNGEPGVDWLAELFEWVSAADERAVRSRDGVGRVARAAAAHGRLGLTPDIPYASVAVAELDRLIARETHGLWTTGCLSPWPDTPLGVAATHDIDFLPDHIGATWSRWARNIAVGALRMKSGSVAARAAFSAVRPLSGAVWLNDSLRRFRAREERRGVDSTWTVVCRSEHGRDPTYRLDSVGTRRALEELAASGAEIGVHGSYTSLASPGRLADEYDRLRAFGHDPAGGRQHWLKFEDGALFRELVTAGARYDATVGFSETVGFRNGASFPFPPYDFDNERAFPILELPLVVMDVALAGSVPPEAWAEKSRSVLREASRWTWGGVSVLWHDTAITDALHPESLGEVYFELLDGPGRFSTGKALVEAVRERYALAGLPDVASGVTT